MATGHQSGAKQGHLCKNPTPLLVRSDTPPPRTWRLFLLLNNGDKTTSLQLLRILNEITHGNIYSARHIVLDKLFLHELMARDSHPSLPWSSVISRIK